MTATATLGEHHDGAPQPRPRRARTGALAVLIAVAVPTGLWFVGQRAVDDVVALTGVPRCEGTEVITTADSSDLERVSIPMTAGFACTIDLEVRNDGGRDVHLGEVVFPVSGPQGGSGFEIVRIGPETVSDVQVDAVVDLDSTLSRADSQVVELAVEFRAGGCMEKGGFLWVDGRIGVGDLLASRDLVVADLPVFAGTADTTC